MKKKSISIIGAGLVGSLLSIYLKKRGYQISVFERRPDMREKSYEGGRSINLALSN
jgi:kynurenine 3-monooxygenase